jgi:hypothetical protein
VKTFLRLTVTNPLKIKNLAGGARMARTTAKFLASVLHKEQRLAGRKGD